MALINLNGGVSLRLPFLLVDQPATLGIRPEHVEFDPDSADNLIYADPSAFEILGMEHFGDRSFAHVELALGEITFLTPTEHSISPKEQLRLRLPPESLHVFGRDGRSLAPAAP